MENNETHWFARQAEQFEESRFAAMTIMLTAQSCFGSIGVFFSMQNESYVLVSLSAAITMGSNSAFIAQGPAKWCVGLFYGSIVINTLVIAINFFL